jgi:hypothetical protein
MRAHDAIMLTLYFLAFALGIEMAVHGNIVGYLQVYLISVLFPLRLAMVLKRTRK